MTGRHPFSELRAKMSTTARVQAEAEAAELSQRMVPADPINANDILAELSPEKRAEVLELGRQLIEEERAALEAMDDPIPDIGWFGMLLVRINSWAGGLYRGSKRGGGLRRSPLVGVDLDLTRSKNKHVG